MRAPPLYPLGSLLVVRRWLTLAVLFVLAVMAAAAEASPPPAGRIVEVFDGIRCEFSPGQEGLARQLAARIAARNRDAAATRTAEVAAAATVPVEPAPLSPADLRANRAKYLGAICTQLALAKPTAWQEECYDAFLDNYDQTMQLYNLVWDAASRAGDQCDKITIWERAELIRRLQAGEKLAGFAYDPVTDKGMSTFYLPQINLQDDQLKGFAERREKLKHEYQLNLAPAEEGGTNYNASVRPRPKPGAPAAPAAPEEVHLQALPVVIAPGLEERPLAEQVDRIWNDPLQGMFEVMAKMGQSRATRDVNIALLVLHETTEVGVIDRYYRGKDRRWFCDGVANYVPWRVIRDLHGLELANTAYDIEAQRVKYSDLGPQADLRKWAASEHQKEGEQETRLTKARYIFASQTVFLMNAHAGEDALPRLFTEIGKTKPNKVSYKTLEKAWQKVSKTKLDAILAEAVQPPVK